MLRTLKQDATLEIELQYEPVEANEVEVTGLWVGEDARTRVDVWPALGADAQAAWTEVCTEDWIEWQEEQKEAEYERLLDEKKGW